MNPRILKTIEEIEKTKKKLADYQNKLRALERQKTELENSDIIALVRGVDVMPDQLMALIHAIKGNDEAPPLSHSHDTTNQKKEDAEHD